LAPASTELIVYYRPGTPGWGPTFAGHPTAPWTTPPAYSEWLPSTALPAQYPEASAETDDPDQDGMNNGSEMLAGTDPTDWVSVLMLEATPRPGDLTEEDRTPVDENQHALYVRSIPGKSYGAQWAESLEGPWHTEPVITATTTQTRLVFERPVAPHFYRVILAQ